MPSQTGSIDLTAQVSANNNAKDYSDNVVDNLEIGGRNLLLRTGSDFFSGTEPTLAGGVIGSAVTSIVTDEAHPGFEVLKTTRGTNTSTTSGRYIYAVRDRTSSGELEIGENYTLSFWAKGEVEGLIFSLNQLAEHTTKIANSDLHITTEWSRFWVTFTTTEGYASFASCFYTTGPANGVYYVTKLKLEKGNKATDWTPAPEDQEALVTSTRTWYATCDTAEATVAKAATTTDSGFELHEGVSVDVKFTKTNTGAVGSLTLNVNDTGAKSIKTMYNNSLANLTTAGQLYAGLVVRFVYSGTYWIASTNYNSDTYNRTRWQNVIRAIATANSVTSGHIICGTENGYRDIGAGVTFDLSYPLLYSGTTISAASGTTDNTYLCINGPSITVNGTVQSAAQYKTVYLKGSLSGNTFTIATSNFLTCVVPTAADGCVYIPLGMFYNSTTNIYFNSSKELWAYVDGAFGPVSVREASAAAKTATTYITHVDNNGITIHPSSTTNNRVAINADGMQIYKGNVDIASYGDTARIGKANSSRFLMNADSLQAYNNNNVKYFEVNATGMSYGSNTVATTQNVTDAVDGISVSGRNLFRWSDSLSSPYWTAQNTTVTSGIATITKAASGDSRIYQMPAHGYWTWEANTEYVASIEARSVSGTGIIFFNFVGANTNPSGKNFNITTEWKRYSCTITSSANPTTGSMTFSNNGATDSVIQLRKPKLEKGSKATEWSPAPEDVNADIANAATTATNYITADANGISIHMANESNTYQRQTSDSTTFYVGGKKRSQVGADGLHVYVGTDETNPVASFGTTARIGKSSERHIDITSDTVGFYDSDGSTNIASFGDIVRIGDSDANHIDLTSDGFEMSMDGEKVALNIAASASTVDVSRRETISCNLPSNTSGTFSASFVKASEGTVDSHIVCTIIDRFGSSGTTDIAKFTMDFESNATVNAAAGLTVTYNKDTQMIQLTRTSDSPYYSYSLTMQAYVYYIVQDVAPTFSFGTIFENESLGGYSSSIGSLLSAPGDYAMAVGLRTTASGESSHAEGNGTTASGESSHAEGHGTLASGESSHAEGSATASSGVGSHAEGFISGASAQGAHAEGGHCSATAPYAHAQNLGTKAASNSQTAIGMYNVEDTTGRYALIIGRGTSNSTRSNALVVDWSGYLIAQGMAGMVQMFAGSTAPTGWLICDGSAISRTDYVVLFNIIGTTWGAGDGSTTFNIPDLRGRAPIGAGTGSNLTTRTLGGTLGEETHVLTAGETGLRAHTHSFTQPTVKVKYSKSVASGSAANHIDGSSSSSTPNPMEVSGGAVGAVTGGEKSGSAHNNMQPSAVVNFIICTGKTS